MKINFLAITFAFATAPSLTGCDKRSPKPANDYPTHQSS